MRILFVCNSHVWGGAESYVYTLATSLSRRQHTVVVASPAGSDLFERVATVEGVTAIELNIGPKLSKRSALDFALRWSAYRARIVRLLEECIARYGIELVHFQFKKEQLIGTGAAKTLGARVVWTEHNELPRPMSEMMIPRHLYRHAARSADRTICVSSFVVGQFVKQGLDSSRLRLCFNGIDSAPPTDAAVGSALRASFGLDPEHVVVGTVARLAWVKNLTCLLDAVPLVIQRVPNARFLIVGDGPERGALEAHAARSGIGPYVVFAGHRSDAAQIASVFDIYACPSLHEGMPFSVMEAMRAAVPIVATGVGGLPELVLPGEAGLVVESNDPAALAASINSLALDTARRVDLGAAAQRRIVEHFSIDAMMSCTERVFREALADDGKTR